nr:MAG TPA: hypothetical protein [Caudoviricetes sp.]
MSEKAITAIYKYCIRIANIAEVSLYSNSTKFFNGFCYLSKF